VREDLGLSIADVSRIFFSQRERSSGSITAL